MGTLPPHLVVHVAIRHMYGYVAKSTPHVHGYVGARSGGQVVKYVKSILMNCMQNETDPGQCRVNYVKSYSNEFECKIKLLQGSVGLSMSTAILMH